MAGNQGQDRQDCQRSVREGLAPEPVIHEAADTKQSLVFYFLSIHATDFGIDVAHDVIDSDLIFTSRRNCCEGLSEP